MQIAVIIPNLRKTVKRPLVPQMQAQSSSDDEMMPGGDMGGGPGGDMGGVPSGGGGGMPGGGGGGRP